MPKKVKQLPDEFKTLEEAAEFWDTHDSTEFMEVLEEVDVRVDLQKRHYLIELDKNTAEMLEVRARIRSDCEAAHIAKRFLIYWDF